MGLDAANSKQTRLSLAQVASFAPIAAVAFISFQMRRRQGRVGTTNIDLDASRGGFRSTHSQLYHTHTIVALHWCSP